MAGVHTVYRSTNASNIIGIGGKLKTPQYYNCRQNDSNSLNGGFPELFYGLYRTLSSGNTKGFDAGIICDTNGYRLFIADNGNGTLVKGWNDHGVMQVAKGAEISLNVTLTGGKVRLECYTGTTLKDILEVNFINTTMYNEFKKGCWANREICIAINPDANGVTHTTPGIYFKDAKFFNTTLTTATNSYVALTSSNSHEAYDIDNGFPGTYYDDSRPVGINVMVNGFVSDQASATTDKIMYPLI